MKIAPNWLREFVDLKVEDVRLAADLTMAGTAVESVSEDQGETTFLMEITTNRVDCMNHYGVARECAAIYDLGLKPIVARLPAVKDRTDFAIEIHDPDLCGRYTGRIIRNTKIQASPPHIARRLEQMDARPINNAADATNYNLIEMGHPTHAFDLDKLEGGKIVVRRAKRGEKLRTLDGEERTLTADDLVIADAVKAVALAGVMGGFDTMITEQTRSVLIEAAWFHPVAIRKTARRLGMHTDASHRFERGADWGATSLAAARVAQLILESGGGELAGQEMDVVGHKPQRPGVKLRHSEVRRILGKDIEDAEIVRILDRLGFRLEAVKASASRNPGQARIVTSASAKKSAKKPVADAHRVALPTWRLDVEREIDLIEEVARIHGYNTFPNTLPGFAGAVVELPHAAAEARVRSLLLAHGYHEAISTSFISRDDAGRFSVDAAVELENPVNEEAPLMRNSLVPGMLDMVARNLNRGVNDVRLFEMGKAFRSAGKGTEEGAVACLGATGSADPGSVHRPARAFSFFDLKGDVEQVLESFVSSSVYFDHLASDYYHPGRAARAVMDGETVAQFGQIHPEVAAARKLRQEACVAEIYLDRLYRHPLRQVRFQPLSRFPAVERDFSFLFGEGTSFESIQSAVAGVGIAELRDFQPVEIFRGGAVPGGKYSVLLRALFQSDERTLTDDEVSGWSQKIIQALSSLGGSLRA